MIAKNFLFVYCLVEWTAKVGSDYRSLTCPWTAATAYHRIYRQTQCKHSLVLWRLHPYFFFLLNYVNTSSGCPHSVFGPKRSDSGKLCNTESIHVQFSAPACFSRVHSWQETWMEDVSPFLMGSRVPPPPSPTPKGTLRLAISSEVSTGSGNGRVCGGEGLLTLLFIYF